ncbi:MAG: hypothetical protein ACRDXB_04880, partial [Actinomycetes bacterium]
FGYTQEPSTGGPGAEFYVAADGSWRELTTLTDGSRRVHEGGPRRLWAHIEDTIRRWRQQLGRPGWDRLGLTVLADGHQRIRVDETLTNAKHRPQGGDTKRARR